MHPSITTPPRRGETDPRVERIVVRGARAGLAAATIYFLLYVIAHTIGDHHVTAVVARGIARFAIGWGLGVPYAWLAGRFGRHPVLVGAGYALIVGAATGQLDAAATSIPLLAYGITLGLVWRHLTSLR